MALKNRLRSQRSKRFDNVLNDSCSMSQKMNFSLSVCDSGVCSNRNKVREESPAKRSIKDSECYTVDGDHIYSSAGSSEAVHDPIAERKLSKESCDKPSKKQCISKNAVMARLNRERKKKYVASLETEKESLRKENNEINRKLKEQSLKICGLRREISYLRGLLSNSKEIGQILRNLKETTGLPVTSSMITTSQKGTENEFLTHLSETEDYQNPEVYQPRTRSDNSNYNFPIVDKDINLGSCSDNTDNDLAALENYPFDFENDCHDISLESPSDENFFSDYASLHSELEFEEYVKFNDLSNDVAEVGICLHVNQKRVSVEICSICNSKARSLLGNLPK